MSNYLFPILGEVVLAAKTIVNGAESLVRKIAGDAEGSAAARERIIEAGREYVEHNVIAASVNIVVRRIAGDAEGAQDVADHLTEGVASTMGFFQPLPIVGEVATAVGATAFYLNGDSESVQSFVGEYKERSLLGGSINSAQTAINGDQEEARRIASRMGTSTLGVVQSVGGMLARFPTAGLPNPVSKALEKSGDAFFEEGMQENPDWKHVGKEAFARGTNGFVTGTYIFAAAGPVAENAIRHDLYKEAAATNLGDQIAHNYRALAEDIICGATEHKILHGWKHKAKKTLVPGKPLINPLQPAQPSMPNNIPIVSTSNIGTSQEQESKKKCR